MGVNVAVLFLGQFVCPFVVTQLIVLNGAAAPFYALGGLYLVGGWSDDLRQFAAHFTAPLGSLVSR